jgi:hypothetical protein
VTWESGAAPGAAKEEEMSEQGNPTDPDEETQRTTGSGDPNDDRAYLQDEPPAQAEERHPTAVEEDEDPIAHDAEAAQEGGA